MTHARCLGSVGHTQQPLINLATRGRGRLDRSADRESQVEADQWPIGGLYAS
jgi:hypothetical protein